MDVARFRRELDDRLGCAVEHVGPREAVTTASVVDAAVALATERLAAQGDVVEVLTSDVEDLDALAEHVNGNVTVKIV